MSMSWAHDDAKANFQMAQEYQDFLEYLRDWYMTDAEFDDLWEKFEIWQSISMPSFLKTLKFGKATKRPDRYILENKRYIKPLILTLTTK